MADCSGDWINSTIHWTKKNGQTHNPPLTLPDGEFHINPHPGSTVFNGCHRDPQGNVTILFKTKCTDLGPNSFTIRIMRHDRTVNPPEVFEYRGVGVITNPATGEAFINGTVFVHGPPDPGDTGTWESTRAGQGVGDADRGDRDRREGGKGGA